MTPSSHKKNKLSLALMDQQWTVALKLIEQKPKLAASSFVLQGFFEGLKDATVFPLHQACACPEIPVSLLEALITAYPAALYKTESSYRRLPLHCACRTGASPATVQALLQAATVYYNNNVNDNNHVQDMCLHPDNLQRLPLHYALSNHAHDATIRLLLDACPASAHAVDQRGWLPLHVACSVGGSSLPVVQWLLDEHPQAASARTLQGSLPQHVLHKTNPHYASMMQLLNDASRRRKKGGVVRSQSMPLQNNPTLNLKNNKSTTTVSRCRSADDGDNDIPSSKHRGRLLTDNSQQRREWKELLVHSSVLV